MNRACEKVFEYFAQLAVNNPQNFPKVPWWMVPCALTEHSNTPRLPEFAPTPKFHKLTNVAHNVKQRVHRHRDRKQQPMLEGYHVE